jgi:hypothetical protein
MIIAVIVLDLIIEQDALRHKRVPFQSNLVGDFSWYTLGYTNLFLKLV